MEGESAQSHQMQLDILRPLASSTGTIARTRDPLARVSVCLELDRAVIEIISNKIFRLYGIATLGDPVMCSESAKKHMYHK